MTDHKRIYNFHHGLRARFLTRSQAAAFLSTPDAFSERLSPLERMARLKSSSPVSREAFLSFLGGCALDWSDEQMQQVRKALDFTHRALERFPLELPEEVLLVHSSGAEEGGGAYTRGNAIILPPRRVYPSMPDLEKLIVHEFFHLFTRFRPQRRDALYRTIGFLPCGELELPAFIEEGRITNPDTPPCDLHYIEITHQGQVKPVTPLLYIPPGEYAPERPFFQQMLFGLLPVEPRGGGCRAVPGAACLKLEEVQGFYEQVGRNTSYIIHPEEILASNFTLLAAEEKNCPSPDVLEKIRGLLQA